MADPALPAAAASIFEVVLTATPALRDWVPKACGSAVAEVMSELEVQLADIEMHAGPEQQPCMFDGLFAKSEKVCDQAEVRIVAFERYVKDGEKGMA